MNCILSQRVFCQMFVHIFFVMQFKGFKQFSVPRMFGFVQVGNGGAKVR